MSPQPSRRAVAALGFFLLLVSPALLCVQSDSRQPAPAASDAANAVALPYDRGAAALWQDLHRLHTRASLLSIVAHPDDEDGPTLTYESRGMGARTALLTLNRGEGGQNAMSPETYDALGILRTQELLSAGRYYGVDQYFTRVIDFGFSKTVEEALDKWDHNRVLYDAVRVVRLTRPLVLTSTFAGNVSDGHGQHQVSGEIAQEVYNAAGDPKIFPDQIAAGLQPWSPLKVYARVPFATVSEKGIYDYATGHWEPARFRNYVDGTRIEGKPTATATLPVGQFDPILGLSYYQIARQGLNEQKSQNGGVGLPPAGHFTSEYHLYAARSPHPATEDDLFAGIDVSLAGIASLAPPASSKSLREGLASIDAIVTEAISSFSANHPSRIAPQLAQGLKATMALLQNVESGPLSSTLPEAARYNIAFELRAKQRQFNQALIDALSLSIRATVTTAKDAASGPLSDTRETFQSAIPGQSFLVRVQLADQGNLPVTLSQVRLDSHAGPAWKCAPATTTVPSQLLPAQAADSLFNVTVPQTAALTRPYFSRPDIEQPYYTLENDSFQNLPSVPYPLTAHADLLYDSVSIQLDQVVQTVQRVAGIGPVFNPLSVAPAISVWVAPPAGILPVGQRSFSLSATVRSSVQGPASGSIHLDLPPGWSSSPASAPFSLPADNAEQTISFSVSPAALQPRVYTITAVADNEGHSYSEGFHEVGYPGLRPYAYYRPSFYHVQAVDVKVAPSLTIGYVMGTGDEVPQSLSSLGLSPRLLSAGDLATIDLNAFDAIILGIRAYAVRPELATLKNRLLEYVDHGGVLIVQYNTPEFDHNYGPYPLRLTSDPEKVVDEAAPVTLLQPADPLFAWPNTITAADFSGWVEERGHGFLHDWDSHYTPLVETHDPGQDPQRGGLLYTRYGKGLYIYAGLALYRQLPSAVPGGFRIFANLISAKQNPDRAPR